MLIAFFTAPLFGVNILFCYSEKVKEKIIKNTPLPLDKLIFGPNFLSDLKVTFLNIKMHF